MKKIYSLIAILIVCKGFAQIPTGYYNNATGTGAVLKTQLYNIIKGHTDNGYNGLWTTYATSDRDHQYENDNTIMDMYSENPTGVDPYTYTYSTSQCGSYSGEGACYNREHMIPQSVFNSSSPMVADAHFITPTDGKVNGQRSNFPHGTVATASWTSLNGGKLGSSSIAGYTGTVFEPINEFKGDIARMYFYFVTRYENTVSSYSYAVFSGNTYPAIDPAFLAMLITWHNNDPVSAFEIARNNAIYARQNNRNPYIDHPEYVGLVWGGGSCPADTQAPTTPTSLTVNSVTSSTISLSWTASTDNIGVTNYDIYVDGVKLASSGGATSIVLNGLNPATTYNIYIVAKDCQGNVSVASTTVTPTTSAGGSCSSPIDENFENIGASATNYAIRTWTNPSTNISWTATDARTDQTINTKAITIRNGALTSGTGNIIDGIGDLTITTQLKFGTVAGTFTVKVDGNAVGTIPYSTTLATTTIPVNIPGTVVLSIDTNSIVANRVAFDDLSWNCYSGVLSNISFNESSFKIYPNPSNGKFKIDFEDSGNYSVEIFSLIGQKVFEEKETNKSNITISHLQTGMYLVKVTKDNKSIVKKIVIN
ncbi:endonuclease [Flavobacterium sp.]|uniref:endonuclease n=1 Tax=Flavobacterium sp. TaxID=239 RepID=UPI0038FCBD54